MFFQLRWAVSLNVQVLRVPQGAWILAWLKLLALFTLIILLTIQPVGWEYEMTQATIHEGSDLCWGAQQTTVNSLELLDSMSSSLTAPEIGAGVENARFLVVPEAWLDVLEPRLDCRVYLTLLSRLRSFNFFNLSRFFLILCFLLFLRNTCATLLKCRTLTVTW